MPCCSGVSPLETLERIRPRHLEMERAQMMKGCKLSLSRKVRGRVKVKTNTREEIARPARPTRALQASTRASIVVELDTGRRSCWRPGGGAYDNSTSGNSNPQKNNGHKKGKGKGKHVDVVEPNQPSETASTAASTASYPSQTPSTVGHLSCTSNVEPWIMGVTINSVPTGDKLVQSICFLTVEHSYTLVHSRTQGTRYRYLILESTQQVEQDYNMTEDDW